MMWLPVQIRHQLASMPSKAHPRKSCVSTPLQNTPPPSPRTGLGLTEAWALVEPGTVSITNSTRFQFSSSLNNGSALKRSSFSFSRAWVDHCSMPGSFYQQRSVFTPSISSLNKCRNPLPSPAISYRSQDVSLVTNISYGNTLMATCHLMTTCSCTFYKSC